MIIYYSGSGSPSNPEVVLRDDANIMLTYHDFHKHNRPDTRFAKIIKKRKKRKGKKCKK